MRKSLSFESAKGTQEGSASEEFNFLPSSTGCQWLANWRDDDYVGQQQQRKKGAAPRENLRYVVSNCYCASE